MEKRNFGISDKGKTLWHRQLRCGAIKTIQDEISSSKVIEKGVEMQSLQSPLNNNLTLLVFAYHESVSI